MISVYVVQHTYNRETFLLFATEAMALQACDNLNKTLAPNHYQVYEKPLIGASMVVLSISAESSDLERAYQQSTIPLRDTLLNTPLPQFVVPDNLLRDPDMITTEDLPNA